MRKKEAVRHGHAHLDDDQVEALPTLVIPSSKPVSAGIYSPAQTTDSYRDS